MPPHCQLIVLNLNCACNGNQAPSLEQGTWHPGKKTKNKQTNNAVAATYRTDLNNLNKPHVNQIHLLTSLPSK